MKALVITTLFLFSNFSKGEEMKKRLMFVIQVKDQRVYAEYRAKISPLFKKYKVKIIKEYRISTVLHSEDVEEKVNRLALFEFPTAKAKKDFFGDDVYKKAKPLFLNSAINLQILVE